MSGTSGGEISSHRLGCGPRAQKAIAGPVGNARLSVRSASVFCGLLLDPFTDSEGEINGICTYDHRDKSSLGHLPAIEREDV